MKHMNEFDKILTMDQLPRSGICGSIYSKKSRKVLQLFQPTIYDEIILYREKKSIVYWGSGLKVHSSDKIWKITPLRQTILMLASLIYKETYNKNNPNALTHCSRNFLQKGNAYKRHRYNHSV